MMKKITLCFALVCFLFSIHKASAQCQDTTITGNLIVSSDVILSGKYTVNGTFRVMPGVTVYVQAYNFGNCGKLEIIANKIIIEGTINGDFAGYTGGNGGAGGTTVTSVTGDANGLTGCSNKDNTGHIIVQGGQPGTAGMGSGAGLAGTVGGNGSGPKQQCLSNNDAAGIIGGAGGAGGGGGASYGGNGTSAANGGAGSASFQTQGLNVSTAYSVVAGTAGTGGANGAVYGTDTGLDIDLGSGGAGGGGGGRSFAVGSQGGKGGAGGALIILDATDSLIITGTVSANGENGAVGGNGGNGGESPKCCNDLCDDCGEATLSAGAGAGAGGGGGSGGGIFLRSNTYAKLTGTLASKGGNGGMSGQKGNGASCTYNGNFTCNGNSLTTGQGSLAGDGGAGGGGRIKVVIPVCNMGELNPSLQLSGGTGPTTGFNGTYNIICSPVSVESLGEKYFDFDIFPNPANEVLNIRFKNSDVSYNESSIEIYDLNGRMIMQENCTLNEQSQQTIRTDELNKGIYIIRLQADGYQILKKFIKN
jgi:hypothetical protein